MNCLVVGKNDFQTAYPEYAKEFHPTMNGELTARDVTAHSNKDRYWLCENGHTYKMSPDKRSKKKVGCSYCSKRRVLAGYNDLVTLFPKIASEWNYEVNEGKPEDYTDISTIRVHWICSECGEKWETRIKDRTGSKHGACPRCIRLKRGQAKHEWALSAHGGITDPILVKEWDYDNNIGGPEAYTPNHNKKVSWKCSDCGYSYEATPSNRRLGRGCPCCAGKIAVKGINDLATSHPNLAAEWDYEKNYPLLPTEITAGRAKKVWWLCSKGHSYSASLLHRSQGTKCPVCISGRQTSFAEQATYFYIKKVFPDAINRYHADFLGRLELDIYIPSIGYAIEYDGIAWHKQDKLKREQKKYDLCHERNIKLIRLREETPKLALDIADIQFGRPNLHEHQNLQDVIQQLLSYFYIRFPVRRVEVNIAKDEKTIYEYSVEDPDKVTFASAYPELAKEWHPIRNGTLLPTMFPPHSDLKVWWLCQDCGCEYEASFGHRSYGTGCPECGREKTRRSSLKPVEMIDPDTNEVVHTFSSASEAMRETGINAPNIASVCKGDRAKAGGYKWRYT